MSERTSYRVPRQPNWKHYTVCDTWVNGDHCGRCEPCYSGKIFHLEQYIDTLRDECRRLGNE